jgi:hypothetical protein
VTNETSNETPSESTNETPSENSGLQEYGWYAYENGTTMDGEGPAGGQVVFDGELGFIEDTEYADARITLEKMPDNTHSLTATIYGGWMSFVKNYPTLEAAEAACETLFDELERLCDLIPDERQKNMEVRVAKMNDEVALLLAAYSVTK